MYHHIIFSFLYFYNVYASHFSLSCLILLTSYAGTLRDNRGGGILVLMLILGGITSYCTSSERDADFWIEMNMHLLRLKGVHPSCFN